MPLSIGLYQFELSHPNQAPHMGMCLFVEDLRAAGHRVDAALVAVDQVEALVDEIGRQRYDLLGFDSIFPIDVIARIKEAHPGIPVVVGGVNALGLFLESAADFAVVGAGRRAISALAGALDAGAPLDGVPNLFCRSGEGIDHTGRHLAWNIEQEVLPYRPFVDWRYLGNGRATDANRHQLSVIPELGCVYQDDALRGPYFADLEAESPRALLEHHDLSDRAVTAMQPFLDNNRGCSFCVFRFQTYTIIDVQRTVEITTQQIRHLWNAFGARQFSLQTENPFRILRPLLERLGAEQLVPEALLLRTLPSILLSKEAELRRALATARQTGTTLIIQQLGFENFDERHLQLYNKGISAADNLRAARLLTQLDEEFEDTIDCLTGHGLMLFDPWTTVDSLAENVAHIDRDARFLSPAVGLGSRLVFYDPFNPIFRKAKQQGLTVRSERDFGWDFRFADSRTTDFVQMVRALNRHLGKRLRETGGEDARQNRPTGAFEGWIFRQALVAYLRANGDAARLKDAFYGVAEGVDRMLAAREAPPVDGA